MAATGRGGRLPFEDVEGKTAMLTVQSDESEESSAAIAAELASRGCRVVLAGSPLSRVQRARDEVRARIRSAADGENTGRVRAMELDVKKGEQRVAEAVEEAWNAFGGIDVLVLSASVSEFMKPVLDTSESEYDNIMASNLKASWMVSIAVAKQMRADKTGRGGSVLFLTAIAGTVRGNYPGVSVYGTSMAAVHHLTKLMAMELGKYRIRVNAIALGVKESDLILKSENKESRQKQAKTLVPLQRWLQFPNDVIGVLLWLGSDSSSFVTGTVVIVDGGISMRRPRFGEFRSRL